MTSQPMRGPNGQRAPAGGRTGPLLGDVATWTIGASQKTTTKTQAVVGSMGAILRERNARVFPFPGEPGQGNPLV